MTAQDPVEGVRLQAGRQGRGESERVLEANQGRRAIREPLPAEVESHIEVGEQAFAQREFQTCTAVADPIGCGQERKILEDAGPEGPAQREWRDFEVRRIPNTVCEEIQRNAQTLVDRRVDAPGKNDAIREVGFHLGRDVAGKDTSSVPLVSEIEVGRHTFVRK